MRTVSTHLRLRMCFPKHLFSAAGNVFACRWEAKNTDRKKNQCFQKNTMRDVDVLSFRFVKKTNKPKSKPKKPNQNNI